MREKASVLKRPVSVTGCLRQTQDSKYFLINARIQSQRSMGSSLNSTRNWNLEGGKDLETHLDCQFTITGTPLADVTRQRLKGQSGDTPDRNGSGPARMKLLDALHTVNDTRGAESETAPPLRLALSCGFAPLHFKTFLAANAFARRPDQSIVISEGLYGDLAGNVERLDAAGCGYARPIGTTLFRHRSGDSTGFQRCTKHAIVNSVGPYRFSTTEPAAAACQASAQRCVSGLPQKRLQRSVGMLPAASVRRRSI